MFLWPVGSPGIPGLQGKCQWSLALLLPLISSSHPGSQGLPLRPQVRSPLLLCFPHRSPSHLFPIKVQLDSKWVTHSLWKAPSFKHASALEGILDAKIYQPHLHFASEGKGLDSSDPEFAPGLRHVLAMGLWASDPSILPLTLASVCVLGVGGSGRQQLLKD